MKAAAVFLALIGSSTVLFGQQPLKPVDPPELVTRRADHIRTMKRLEIAPLTSYIQSLTILKQQYMREAKSEAIAAVDAD